MKRYFPVFAVLLSAFVSNLAFASEGTAAAPAAEAAGLIAIGASIAIGIAILGATLSQGRTMTAALEAIGRNPAAAGKIFTPMILGLVFMEALGILAFVIAYTLAGKF